MTKKEAKESFGKRVKSGRRLKKKVGLNSKQVYGSSWVAVDVPVEGLLIGVRTYNEGSSNGYPFYKEPYIITKLYQVALIAPNWRQNPVPVLLEDCELDN